MRGPGRRGPGGRETHPFIWEAPCRSPCSSPSTSGRERSTPARTRSSSPPRDWLAIQTYTAAAKALPITPDALAKAFKLASGDSPATYSDILKEYTAIHEHCATWDGTTFPDTVHLATDIVDYDRGVDTYYGALKPLLTELQKPNPPDGVKEKFKAILDLRSAEAASYRDKAQHVSVQITTFKTQTDGDATEMTRLVAAYNTTLGSTSDARKQLQTDLETWNTTLTQAQEEYHHDVVVAATTAAYAWVGFPLWPVGLVAAGIVAGIYGPKAVQAKNEIEGAQARVDELTAEVARDTMVMAYLNSAETSMGSISTALTNAHPIIQKIAGVWDALASDLKDLGQLIVDDIEKALPIIMDLGIDDATRSWHAVAKEANSYRVNAYITTTGSPSN